MDASQAFKRDFSVGHQFEHKVLNKIQEKYPTAVLVPGKFKPYDIFIPEKDLKVEVKVDLKSQETKNILIELKMYGKKSGLLSTKADYWIIFTGKEYLWTTPKKIIECIIMNNIPSQKVLGAGDDAEKDACLIPIHIFKKYLLDK